MRFVPIVLSITAMLVCGCQNIFQQQREAEQQGEQHKLEEQRAQYGAAITSALQADAETGGIKDYAERVHAMRAIDTSQCPPDFRAAYVDHIYAWQYASKVEAAQAELNSDDNINATLMASLIATLADSEVTPIANHLEAEQKLKEYRTIAWQKVSDTFQAVERTAVTYGATLPQPR